MPFRGFVCDITGEQVSPEACLDCAERGGGRQGDRLCPFTPPILKGLIDGHQPRNLMGYSATELSGCPRKVILKEEVDYWVAPRQAYWAFRGRLAHALLEAANDPERALCEQRFYAEVEGVLVTGQPDVVYPEQGLLVDYKTTKQVPRPHWRYACPDCGQVIRENGWKARKGSQLTCPSCAGTFAEKEIVPEERPAAAYDGHVQQVNVYRWLLACNGIPIDRAEILYLDMAEALRIAVPLWPLEETEIIVAAGLARLLELGDDGLPYGVQDDDRSNWECGFCPVADACREAAARPAPDLQSLAVAALYPA